MKVKGRKRFAGAMLGAGLLFVWTSPSFCQTVPDLKNQAAWGDKEKQEFLKYLKSNQPTQITGQVKETGEAALTETERQTVSKPKFLTMNIVSDTVLTMANNGELKSSNTALGPKIMIGGHLFSWVRYFTGIKWTRVYQGKLDGSRARLSHFEVPLGVELALIPLGTPHTRYVLMRAGISGHCMSGKATDSDFESSILGWHAAWNLGVGYEWQFANSNWRAHALAEGYKSIISKGTPQFYGVGFTGGLVYTF